MQPAFKCACSPQAPDRREPGARSEAGARHPGTDFSDDIELIHSLQHDGAYALL